ncbi:ECF transporter S component [Streptococcus halichoeri]|uniref:ECF transporter S component n=1 Tax=Streptococcus halichoeri TaxID=254785 RepID=UPI0013576427|nr:ECF transporter S component [Streptococcus halichoeri]
MNQQHKSSQVAIVAIFFAVMLLIHFLSSFVFMLWPVPIKPTLVHIPVIIASIVYGPRIGATLGGLMGAISVINSTIVLLPTSYLFSPFVEHGNIYSLVIAIVPRVLIGILPYYTYKLFSLRFGAMLSGIVGSLTNTVFVLSGIFIFFGSVFNGSIKALLTAIISTNALAEVIISAIIAQILVPRLLTFKQ